MHVSAIWLAIFETSDYPPAFKFESVNWLESRFPAFVRSSTRLRHSVPLCPIQRPQKNLSVGPTLAATGIVSSEDRFARD